MQKSNKKPAGRRVPRKITPARLERIALAYLERYASSIENLRRVLMRRVKRSTDHHGTDPEDGAVMVNDVLQRYQEAGLLDDDAYARMRTTTLHRRGASKRLIRAQLASKGVESAIIGKALNALDGEHSNADLAAACRYARRRRLGPWRTQNRDDRRERDLAA
ncbi:MAG: RecX family transcriptional regulator, partial [Alphaproteobacteria bacterium]|nr:RecX family transcriptional regulator [Alphaproteobacteria bacterium]